MFSALYLRIAVCKENRNHSSNNVLNTISKKYHDFGKIVIKNVKMGVQYVYNTHIYSLFSTSKKYVSNGYINWHTLNSG